MRWTKPRIVEVVSAWRSTAHACAGSEVPLHGAGDIAGVHSALSVFGG